MLLINISHYYLTCVSVTAGSTGKKVWLTHAFINAALANRRRLILLMQDLFGRRQPISA